MSDKVDEQISGFIEDVAELIEESRQVCALNKGEAMMRKWVADIDLDGASHFRQMCVMADAASLAGELLLAQPSTTGATAFDRLAKRPVRRTARQIAALAALRGSRFVLLTIIGDMPDDKINAADHFTDEAVLLAPGCLPAGLAGTPIFGRLVALPQGMSIIAGVPTPLDTAALAVATEHAAARLKGAGAGARWAEAIYAHVVRHGTMDVPGVNRPMDMASYEDDNDPEYAAEDAEGQELVDLAQAWVALAGAPPDEDLLRRSRERCDPNSITSAVIGMATANMRPRTVAGWERLVLVQMETVLRREQVGSGTVTLDGIAANLDRLVAHLGLPSTVRDTFQNLRQRVTGRAAPGGIEDADLGRLLQRIRGLRAKTVDQGCTEQEALTAAEKVAELLDRYGLSLGELDFRAQTCEGGTVQTARKRLTPLDNCVPAIAEFFDCRVWGERPGGGPLRYMFFGLRADVAAALYLYELVDRAFMTETEAFKAGPVYIGMAGERRTATTSFQVGLATGIRGKLRTIREARAKRQSSGRDLVIMKAAIVDDEVAKLGLLLHIKATNQAKKRLLEDAFVAGTEAAARFEWTPGISEAA